MAIPTISTDGDWNYDGVTGWMLTSLDVEADPTGTGPGSVRLPKVDKTMTPYQARELAAVLLTAADVAEGAK